MNPNSLDPVEMKIALQITSSFIIPIIASIITLLFSKPKKDEEELSKKRQQILLNNRNLINLKINDICINCLAKIKALHRKASEEIDELVPKSGSDLNGEILMSESIMQYIFANSHSLKSIFQTENHYKSAKNTIRFYKYVIIIIPFIAGGLYLLYIIFINNNINWSTLVVYILAILAIIIIIWFIKEKKKDKYTDMSDELEGL